MNKISLTIILILLSIFNSYSQDINLRYDRGSNNQILNGSSASEDAGTQFSIPTGCTFSIPYRIQNNDVDSTLELTGDPVISLSGSLDFTVIQNPDENSIDPNEGESFILKFEPTSLDTQKVIISIESNDINDGTFSFEIAVVADASSKIWYVDKDAGAGDTTGGSWSHAFINLHAALDSAGPCDQIWVAEGRYIPEEGRGGNEPTLKDTQFRIDYDVAIYGGFNATEVNLSERNFKSYVTVLSGDLDKNDVTNADGITTNPDNIIGRNAINVIRISANAKFAIIDGFTICGGDALTNATGSNGDNIGAGLFISGGSINNCHIQGNKAQLGGGMLATGGPLVIRNTVFSDNEALTGSAIVTVSDSCSIVNCGFWGNKTMGTNSNNVFGFHGATILNLDKIDFFNCTITGNINVDSLGVFHNATFTGSGPVSNFTNTIIWNNKNALGSTNATVSYTEITTATRIDQFCVFEGLALSGQGSRDGTNDCYDPKFVDSFDLAIEVYNQIVDLNIQSNSFCLDYGTFPGTNVMASNEDLNCNGRIVNGRIDMGAYENQSGFDCSAILNPIDDIAVCAGDTIGTIVFTNNLCNGGILSEWLVTSGDASSIGLSSSGDSSEVLDSFTAVNITAMPITITIQVSGSICTSGAVSFSITVYNTGNNLCNSAGCQSGGQDLPTSGAEIVSGTYAQYDHYSLMGSILNGSDVTVKAKDSITFKNNFNVEPGGLLTAQIDECID